MIAPSAISRTASGSANAMRIAFYAPLKPPSHPTPSGDRRIARLLLKALRKKGHDVRVVSTFRSFEGGGEPAAQRVIKQHGSAEAERLLRTTLKRWRPELWFTYHIYQKAPDWLGPPIARKLCIPYLVAEAAYAPRRSKGRWDEGLAAVAAALRRADTALMLNPNDEECVAPLLRKRAGAIHTVQDMLVTGKDFVPWIRGAPLRPAAVEPLLPFLDTARYRRAFARRETHRRAVARRFRIPRSSPWLLAVGMMRPGDKLASYRLLARALRGLGKRPWRLLIVGDGPARDDVRKSFAAHRGRVHFLGALSEADLIPVYAASDLYVWPAINEAIGMSILEAQAAGLPVIAGDVGAIGVIVASGVSGCLVPVGRAAPFRRAVAVLLAAPKLRRSMAEAAVAGTRLFHDIDVATAHLDAVLQGAVARARKRRR
jgi:glycosyltransferase involved in cell wall biosynthesis